MNIPHGVQFIYIAVLYNILWSSLKIFKRWDISIKDGVNCFDILLSLEAFRQLA